MYLSGSVNPEGFIRRMTLEEIYNKEDELVFAGACKHQTTATI